ncbi:hypothetical protein HID58_071943, partial [Brassica napus]
SCSVMNVHSCQCQHREIWYVQVCFLQKDSLSKAKPRNTCMHQFMIRMVPRAQPSSKIVELADRGPKAEHLKLPNQQMISSKGMSMGAKQEAGTRKADEKKDKTVLVVKLEKFDTAAKIKLIKEVRVFTILGHSEAKMLAYCGREGEEERLRSWSRKESNFKTKNIE